MNNNLYLLDVSAFVHAGRFNKYAHFEQLTEDAGAWRTLTTPAGGVSLIFNTLYDIVGKGDIIACCDRNPVIKKDMHKAYKSDREHRPDVELNKNVAEYILKKCGVMTVAMDGYEADDIIATYVKKFYDMYDKIYIYCSDSDLYYLIDEAGKVEIRPSSSQAKAVTRKTYDSTKVHGTAYKYNTITINKIMYGDASDCIPPLPKELQEAARDAWTNDPECYARLGDKDWVKMLAIEHPLLYSQVDLVFPLEVSDLPLIISTPDKEAIQNWGATMHNKLYKGMCHEDFNSDEEIKEMQSLGYYLEDEA